MEVPSVPNNIAPTPGTPPPVAPVPKKSKIKLLIPILAIVIVVLLIAGFFMWKMKTGKTSNVLQKAQTSVGNFNSLLNDNNFQTFTLPDLGISFKIPTSIAKNLAYREVVQTAKTTSLIKTGIIICAHFYPKNQQVNTSDFYAGCYPTKYDVLAIGDGEFPLVLTRSEYFTEFRGFKIIKNNYYTARHVIESDFIPTDWVASIKNNSSLQVIEIIPKIPDEKVIFGTLANNNIGALVNISDSNGIALQTDGTTIDKKTFETILTTLAIIKKK